MAGKCNAVLAVRPVMQEDDILGIVHDTVEFVFCGKRVTRARGFWNGQAWFCSEEHMGLPRPVEAVERHHCTDRCGDKCATPTCLNAVAEGLVVCAGCRAAYARADDRSGGIKQRVVPSRRRNRR